MKLRCFYHLLAMAMLATTAVGQQDKASERPNIILIVADDLGYNTVGYKGDWIKTPSIDRIANEGVAFDRFYVSPMCSPTRAGLLTGRYAMRLGMARSVVRPWMNVGLSPAEETIAEALGKAGYKHRGAFGKWHLGHLAPQYHPLAQGFTEFEGMYNGAADYWTRDRNGENDWHVNRTPTVKKGYSTDLIADAAAAFVRKHAADGPFFCYVPFSAPHDPLQAPDAYLAKYQDLDNTPSDGKPSDRQALAAMVTCMDDGIGRIMKAVEDSGATSRTLVWFMSDNGGLLHIPGVNKPYRQGKLTTYEGGVRVPAAAWWPGKVSGGRRIAEPVANIDLLPTLLAAAQVDFKAEKPLDGVNMWPVVSGAAEKASSRELYFFDGQSGSAREQIAVIGKDGWKMIVTGPDIRRGGFQTPQHKVELFNLAADSGEAKDLSGQEPDRVASMGKKLVEFRNLEPKDSFGPENKPKQGWRPPPQWENPETTGATTGSR